MSDFQHESINAPVVRDLDEAERPGFLPRLFGHDLMIVGEATVFNFMEQLSRDYGGGFWVFKEASNGALYMCPYRQGTMTLEWHGNGFEGSMSADAAGLVATLYALSHLSFSYPSDRLAESYERLADFASSHAEAAAIYSAID